MSIKERFNLLREVSSAFSFLYTRDKLLLVQQENALLTCCKEFQKKFGDIDSDEMSAELQRFVLILQKKRNLKTAQDFLNYCFVLFYLPYLSSIHEKANCIAILWTGSPHSLGSCLFRGLWVTCLPHKGGASR